MTASSTLKIRFLLLLSSVFFLVSRWSLQAQVVLSIGSPTTWTPGTSSIELEVSLKNEGASTVNVNYGTFYFTVGGYVPFSSPSVTGFTFSDISGSPFGSSPGTDSWDPVGNGQGTWSRYINQNTVSPAVGIALAPSTVYPFAKITINTSNATTEGETWSFNMSGSAFDGTLSVGGGSGTFSAVPEPEETMAVTAGALIVAAWFLRRRSISRSTPKAGCP